MFGISTRGSAIVAQSLPQPEDVPQRRENATQLEPLVKNKPNGNVFFNTTSPDACAFLSSIRIPGGDVLKQS